jgi:hypothetical protein
MNINVSKDGMATMLYYINTTYNTNYGLLDLVLLLKVNIAYTCTWPVLFLNYYLNPAKLNY